jgi:hypothetical protein
MDKVTDDLLSGVSDALTNDTELFLINNVSDKDAQAKIVDLMNRSFKEGADAALAFYQQSKADLKKQAEDFQTEFEKKLRGQDSSIS